MAKGIQGSISSVITVGAFILIGVILIKVLKPLGIVDDVKGLFSSVVAEGSKAFDDKSRIEDTAKETQAVVETEGSKTRDVVEESEKTLTKEVRTGTSRVLTDAERKAIADRQRDAIIHAQNKFLVKKEKEEDRNVVLTPASQTPTRSVVQTLAPSGQQTRIATLEQGALRIEQRIAILNRSIFNPRTDSQTKARLQSQVNILRGAIANIRSQVASIQ